MRTIQQIILHCSDSEFGSASLVEQWHLARGFKRIGYHYVVLNGYCTALARKAQQRDCNVGAIEAGRAEALVGAHCKGFNLHSIGVCLIGKGEYPPEQVESARKLMVETLLPRYPQAMLLGHYELNPQKTCPMIDMNQLRWEWGIDKPN